MIYFLKEKFKNPENIIDYFNSINFCDVKWSLYNEPLAKYVMFIANNLTKCELKKYENEDLLCGKYGEKDSYFCRYLFNTHRGEEIE